MHRYGFTGTRSLEDRNHAAVQNVLRGIKAANGMKQTNCEFTTGGAFGIDTYVAAQLIEMYPRAYHRVILPNLPYNPEVETLDFNEVIALETGGYRERNAAILDHTDRLYAFPKGQIEQMRGSGTWMTIRMAEKRDIPTVIAPL